MIIQQFIYYQQNNSYNMSIFTSTAFNGNFAPGVVTNGAVLLLDAGNLKSYPGTGATWFDLSGNGNNATLTNIQSTWTGSLGGYFDWPNNTAHLGTITHSNSLNVFNRDFTIEFWCTLDVAAGGTSDNEGLFVKGTTINSNPGTSMLVNRDFPAANWGRGGMYVNNVSGFNASSGRVNDPWAVNSWQCIQYVRQAGALTTFCNLRWLWTTTNQTGNANNSTNITMGKANTSGAVQYPWDGKQSFFGIWNRALTFNELRQNYNTMANRVGIAIK